MAAGVLKEDPLLKLYHILPRADHPGSHNALKVAVLLRELGLEFDLIDVDSARELRPADAPYRQLNPNGLTPILDDDGFVLWESAAILQYLCDSRGPTPLLPTEPRRRARALQWLAWEGTTWIPALMAFYLSKMAGGESADAATRVSSLLGMLEQQLAGRIWVAESYSIADIALGATVPAALPLGAELSPYPSLRGWLAVLRERPAWQDDIFLGDLRAGGLA